MEQSDKHKSLCDRICKQLEQLKTGRSNWENHWQECYDYIVPRKNDVITSRLSGDKRNTELFDSTAIMANQLLSGALHGMLTNPTTQFFDLIMGDPMLDDMDEVKEWLQVVGQKMFIVLNNSNFQTEVHEVYIDIGATGTACLYMGEHDENYIHFAARPLKEIYVAENNLGLIDTVHRVFKWKPKQIVQEFGEDKVPEYVKDQYEKGCEDEWEIIHCVEAKGPHDDGFHKYKSCYIVKEQKLLLSEGGFNEFPYAVPRWTKTSGEVWGRGPGMDMLPDIKMVNKMMETTLKGAQKTVDPPLMVADDGVIGKVRLTPGGLTVVRPTMEIPIRPLITDARIDFGYQAVEDIRKHIRSGFYVDQLQLNEGPQMTATEVMQRTEEKLRLMGPVLGRQHFEFLRPIVERLFGIMYRRELIPPPPRQIQGKKFDVRYSSLIARAQRMNEGNNLTRAISTAAPIVQVAPTALDNLDSDEAVRHIFDLHGVPQKLLRKRDEVADIREQRQQAQQQAMDQAQQVQQAEMASKIMPGMAAMEQARNQ